MYSHKSKSIKHIQKLNKPLFQESVATVSFLIQKRWACSLKKKNKTPLPQHFGKEWVDYLNTSEEGELVKIRMMLTQKG